jgi:predicted TIM-barrel fold metal-dependent hydrolase
MSKVTIVSVDGHSVMPPELWPEYLEKKYHDFLPQFQAEDEVNTTAMFPLADTIVTPEALEVFDKEGAYRAEGWQGAWDADVRLAEMDREGIAAEFVHHGFFRVVDLGFSMMSAARPFEVVDAGVRAHDRWAAETFGTVSDRFLLIGAIGSCTDLDVTLAEFDWVADHGFIGTYAPGFAKYEGHPPLFDEYYEPLWSRYEDRSLAVVVHAGYGFDQGFAYEHMEKAVKDVEAAGGTTMDMIMALSTIFNADFLTDLKCRKALWQLMLGGVFDRHPNLRVIMTEVRGDWIPATLEFLDKVYDEHRADLPAQRKPSEYWQSNCLAGLSFLHTAEVEMRDQIGIDKIAFGRDYPHTEATWPNTMDYLRTLFAGVPENDVRMMLGENAIRFFGLDASELARVAERIGPTIDELTNPAPVDPALIEHLDLRCGLLKPAEGGSRLAGVDELLRDDLVRMGAS